MYCIKCGVELADSEKKCPLCGTVVFNPELSRPALRMRQFAAMIEELRAFSADNTPDALLEELLDKTGYCLLYTSPSPRDS